MRVFVSFLSAAVFMAISVLPATAEIALSLHNARKTPVDLSYLDSRGKETEIGPVEAGETAALETGLVEGMVLRIRDNGTLIDEYVLSSQEQQEYVIAPPLRSAGSKTKIGLSALNQTGRPVEVFWIDYQGNEKSYGTIKPGASWGISTYATHPWRFKIGGKPVGVYVTDASPSQKINLCRGLSERLIGERGKRFVENQDIEYLCWLRTDQPRGTPITERADLSYQEGFIGNTLDVNREQRVGYNLLWMDPSNLQARGTGVGAPFIMEPMSLSTHDYHLVNGVLIPNDLFRSPALQSVERTDKSVFFTETDRQQSFGVNVGLKGGIDAGGKGGASTGSQFGYSENRKRLENSSSTSFLAVRSGSKFWLTMVKPLIRLSSDFRSDVWELDGADYEAFKRFFENFGTHYQLSTLYGGMAMHEEIIDSGAVETAFSTSMEASNTTSVNVKGVSAERSVGFSTSDASASSEKWENQATRTYIRGGRQGTNFDNWDLGDAEKDLVPVKVDLRPLYDLVWPQTMGASEPEEIARIRAIRRQMRAAYEEYIARESRQTVSDKAEPRAFAIKLDSIKLTDEDDAGNGGEFWGYVDLLGRRDSDPGQFITVAGQKIPTVLTYLKSSGTKRAWKQYGSSERNTLDKVDTVDVADDQLFPGVNRGNVHFAIMPGMKKTGSGKNIRWKADYGLNGIRLFPNAYFREDDNGGESEDDKLYVTILDAKMTLQDVVNAPGRKKQATVTKFASGIGRITIKYTVREVSLNMPYNQAGFFPDFPDFDGPGSN